MPESDVGSYFGKYFLLKKLAAGGMGEVFLAKQQGPAGFEKILIIKKVLAHLTENKEFIELFLSEARLAARMNHRNIVQVFELGEQDGNYFIAMEYVQGKALRDVIDAALKRKEKIPGELCRSVVEQICDGSSYAHNLSDVTGRGLNIVHRDLNPQNVLVSYTGDVKVIDFGIAKSEMSTVKTEAGMIKGKFVYMSPEQSMAKKLDKRSDIYAIGITLYEMLTGINPFHKNNIVLTLEAVQRLDPPPVSEYDPSYAPFDPIISKALAKDRDRRYSDAAEMQDDLRRIMLPPSPERLGVFMSRIFRQQLEEDQKLLKDTDAARVTAAAKAGGRTPAKAVPVPQQQEPENATMMLAPKPSPKAAPKPAPRPAPRAPAPPPKKQGAGDTLMDMASPANPPAPHGDDAAGATMMLKPGTALPPPPRAAKKVTDTMPEGGPPHEDAGGATAFLGTAPARPEKPRKAPGAPVPNSVGAGGTNIMTPEESAQSQREALAKMQAAGTAPANSPPSSRTQAGRQSARGTTNVGVPPKKAGGNKKLLIAVVGVVVVIALVLVGVLLLGDDEKKPVKKHAAPAPIADTAPADQAPPAPPEAPAPDAPKTPKAIDPAAAEAAKAKKADAAAAAAAAKPKGSGTLSIDAGANMAISYNGATSKGSGNQKVNLIADTGTVEIGDATSPYKVAFDFSKSGKELVVKVKSTPWAIVSLDQVSKGKTPAEVHLTSGKALLELKKPGQDTGMQIHLQFNGS
jgi:serine/threonine protein kinase